MYDTSDIRKGLKIMIDGSPYTVVEFQFVKPGKGAAFTRTKMKNLLTGNVLERNLRSGEKLAPADVETKTMQYLYADADSFVFMDTTTYDQVGIQKDTVGVAHKTLPCGTRVAFRYNGVTVITQVIDRGPYVSGRQWDMTHGLCALLDHCFTGGGVYYRILG